MANSNYAAKIREISESKLPSREAHIAALGKIKNQFQVLHSQVLVATYVQPEKTQGGIIIPDNSMHEGRFQGSIGLVIALGPGAFKDDNVAKFHGAKLEAMTSWVMFRASDGLELFINQVPCRLFEDVSIKMVVENPVLYW